MLELEHLTVRTKARAEELHYRLDCAHEFLVIMYPAAADPIAVAVATLERVIEMIGELSPDAVSVEGAMSEDCSGLHFAVHGCQSGASLH